MNANTTPWIRAYEEQYPLEGKKITTKRADAIVFSPWKSHRCLCTVIRLPPHIDQILPINTSTFTHSL